MLSINISELILTILNFLLLLFVLNKLLYKPLITFMDQRKARIDAVAEKSRAAATAELESERADKERAETRRKAAQELIRHTDEDTAHRRAKLLEKLHEDEERELRAIEEDIQRIETDEAAELVEDENELVRLLAERLLGEKL